MKSPSVDIVIVNWNSGLALRECLESLAGNDALGSMASVIVADNASKDGSHRIPDYPTLPLQMIHNKVNHGFAAACNQAASLGKAKYILFLNPDTRLSEGSIGQPFGFMEQPENRRIGICGVRMKGENGRDMPSCARFPSPWIFFGKTLRLNRIMPALFPQLLLSPEELARSRVVDEVIGAFFFVRRDLFERLGGFDERYFVYFEEVDFALRAMQAGYLSYFLADTEVFHQGAACSSSAPAASMSYFWRSSISYGMRHYSRSGKLAICSLILFIEPAVRLGAALASRSLSGVRTVLGAYMLLLCSLAFSIRPKIQGERDRANS